MRSSTKRVLAAVGAAALLLPAGAAAKPGHADDKQRGHAVERSAEAKAPGVRKAKRGKGHAKPRTVLVRGTVVSSSAEAVTVAVTRGNKAARRAGLVGQEVTFTLAVARVVVADVDGSGTPDGADLAKGDAVVVQARLPRTTTAADGPFAARKVVDRTHPPVEAGEAPAPAPSDSSEAPAA